MKTLSIIAALAGIALAAVSLRPDAATPTAGRETSKPLAPASADWPMFRGNPGLTGVASGSLPDKLSMLWSFKTGGPVKSSAAIVGGKVFIGSDDGNLYTLNLADGKKIWTAKTEGAIESSPLVLDGRVFVGSMEGFLYAVSAADGKELWKFKTEDKIVGAPNWVKSPDGRANWILAGSHDFKLYCLDAATGRSNWVYESGNYINGTPAVDNGVTAFGGCDALLHVISLDDGRQVKEVDAGAYVAGSAALADGRAYFGHLENAFLCIDIVKEKTAWTYKERNFPYYSSPAVTKDRVLFGGRDKRVHCVKRDTGEADWTFATQGKVDSSPVVVDGKVVVGSEDGRLYVLSLKDGKELWNYEIGQGLTSSPAVASGKIVIGSEDGSVYCFGTKKN
ncbi:MAG: PQQ-binding-like beta-propeller repeat protein [Verrucomicrobia bacterium]|nr:PQQ-binding-like beta-propeller repeat protein [Verrucomicrobiota bacterium]